MKPTVLSHPSALLRRPDLPKAQDVEEIAKTDSVAYANEHLRYKHPERLKRRASTSLANALRVTGIAPFDPQTVRDYKARCILEKQGGVSNAITVRIARTIAGDSDLTGFNTSVMVCSIILLVLGLGTTIASIVTAEALAWWSVSCMAIGGLMLPITCKIRALSHEWEWETVKLEDYADPIPQFALDTAREIHMRAPTTIFKIEQLVQKKTKRVVDPFLIAINPEDYGDMHHVEVWDEPAFEQKRRV